jgi:small-conductance mechanosensitive channel
MNQFQLLISIASNPTTWQGAVLYAAVIIVIAWLIGRFFHLIIRRYLVRADKAGLDSTSVRFLGQLGSVVVYIVAFLGYASVIPALHSLGTTWLASVGVISLVVGLATQSTLSNLVAGISLILYRPFRLGDRIQVTIPGGTEIGVVESIDLGYTSIRAHDGRRIVLPNSLITNQTNINFSRKNAHVVLEIPITIPPNQDFEKVRTILLNSTKEVQNIFQVNGCFVTSLTNLGTTAIVSVMCMDPGDIAQIKSDVLTNASRQLKAAKIVL